jgi:hypothetical protein
MITLYGMSSPNVRKILIALEEMAIAYQPHLVAWTSRIKERPAVHAACFVMDMFGALDATDRAAATPENIAMFTGHHIQAPTAIEAATEWKRR